MPWTQAPSNVVIIAQRFNPTAAGEYQLITHKVITKDEVGEGSIFTDVVVQVRSTKFNMLLLPEQLQFVPTVECEHEQSLILAKMGALVRALPVTPYKGVGLNFAWLYIPPDKDVDRVTRELFYVADRPLFQGFGTENTRYGGYMSKDFAGFRLKLDIKPMLVTFPESESEHGIQFAFNFHADLGADGGSELQYKLSLWNTARAEAERIVDIVEKRS